MRGKYAHMYACAHTCMYGNMHAGLITLANSIHNSMSFNKVHDITPDQVSVFKLLEPQLDGRCKVYQR